MKYILLLLTVFFFIGCVEEGFEAQEGYKLEYVIDGDTLFFNETGPLRLASIDTPETYAGDRMDYVAQNCTNGDTSIIQEIGMKASEFVEFFAVPGITYKVIEFGRDKYDRVLGEVYIKKKSLNIKIVQEGFGVPYIFSEDINSTELEKAMEEAKKNRRGLWLNYYDEMSCLENLDRRRK